MATRKETYYNEARDAVQNFWNSYHVLIAMQTEWNSLDYLNSLGDGEGVHAGITAGDLGSAIFDTTNEVKLRIFDTAHKTNYAKLLY